MDWIDWLIVLALGAATWWVFVTFVIHLPCAFVPCEECRADARGHRRY